MSATAKKSCFIISPIGEEGSDVRKRSDQVLRHILTPAVQACGYEPIRADKLSEPGLITSQVIQHIVEDPLVVADLTGTNANVFYELAVRHAIRKPLVQVIQKGEKLPFDVAGMRTIALDHRDLDSVEETKSEIQRQIRAVEGKSGEQIESPISFSIELQSLKQSGRPEDSTLVEIVSNVIGLRSEIAEIQKRLSSPESLLPPAYMRELAMLQGSVLDRRYGNWNAELRHLLEQLRGELTQSESAASKESAIRLLRLIDRVSLDDPRFAR